MKRTLDWQVATVESITAETKKVKSFKLRLPEWMRHRAGQHYDLRLTAADGYQAQRSYSIASEPERTGEVMLTIERLEDGEVSSFMHDVVVPGDQIELRGPVGGYFVWEAGGKEPLLLIAGGSGIVPLMSMLRHRRAAGAKNRTTLLYSSRSLEDIIYFEELEGLARESNGPRIRHTLTRSQPAGWEGFARRIDRAMLEDVTRPLEGSERVFICGPTLLVESTANALVDLGFQDAQIRTERFGPTGG